MNILLLGSDSRGDPWTWPKQGAASNQRSDTMMWVHIPADRKNIFLMSIMRDTWVDIPGHGEAKINAAMAFGGVPLVVQTLEGLFNNRIDHVAIVDFEGFKAITDALGGVEVDVPIPFTSAFTATTPLPPGRRSSMATRPWALSGNATPLPTATTSGCENQQMFLKSLLNKVLSIRQP